MARALKPETKPDTAPQDQPETPGIEQRNWNEMEGAEIAPENIPEEGDFRRRKEPDGTLPEEDDDNPYQESDEALPEDQEERAIARDPSKEGSQFDEI